MSPDANEEQFPENLPEIGKNEFFCFDCGPQTPCFNRCCAELALPLTPYDILRLRRNLDMESTELMTTFARIQSDPDTGFPMPMLRMIEGPEAPCPFVTPAGCSIYEDRPGACRAYPLGRGTKIAKTGVSERFFIVREEHCRGFDSGTCRTPHEWFAKEGLEPYNLYNDRHMRLLSMVRASGRPLDARLAGMAMLSLFQLEKFRQLIDKMNIFDRLDIERSRQKRIMEDTLAGDEACLDFAYDWLELVIFGKSDNLGRKDQQIG